MKYIYACITDKCMKPIDEVMKTRKYKKAEELQNLLQIEQFAVDICSSGNRKKLKLEQILSTEGNVIIITDLSSLGKKDELPSVYNRIIETNNEILICYFDEGGILVADELSSVNIKYEKKSSFDLEKNLQLINNLSSNQYRVNSCKLVSQEIIDAYWQIEKGERTEREVVKELGMSKTTFIKRIDEYIFSDGWVKRYYEEIQNPDFVKRPIKLGGVTEKGKQFYEYLENNPEEEQSYPLFVILKFSEIEKELFNLLEALGNPDESSSEYIFAFNRLDVLAHHYYRQALRYRKYLYNLKYRKPE